MRILPLLFVLLGLIGCSTAEERQDTSCGQIDWYQRGLTDGALGLSLATLEEYRKSCPDDFSDDDIVVYTNGRNAGLVEYCSADSGYEMGRMGVAYNQVCPPTSEPLFLEHFARGKKARQLEMENDVIESRIDLITQRLALRLSDAERAQLRMELSSIRQLRVRNQKELTRISK